MKLFYDKNEPMPCAEALWYSTGADEGELVTVKYLDSTFNIECDGDRIFVYDDEKKTLIASFNANLSIEFLTDVIEHMLYKLKH